ncbi:MAG: hypothetical protein OCC49_12995 [Fibrobacterales bacterium]
MNTPEIIAVTASSSEDEFIKSVTLDSIDQYASEISSLIQEKEATSESSHQDSLTNLIDSKINKLELLILTFYDAREQEFSDVEYAIAIAKAEGVSEDVNVSNDLLDSLVQNRVDSKNYIEQLKKELGLSISPKPIILISSSSLLESSISEDGGIALSDTIYYQATEDSLYTFTIGPTISEGDTLIWGFLDDIKNGLVELEPRVDSVIISFKASRNYFGQVSFRLEVSNNDKSDTVYVVVQVAPINDIPSFEGEVSIAGTIIEGQKLKIITKATCSDQSDKGAPTPTLINNWYGDTDSIGFDGELISVGRSMELSAEHVGYYLYGVVLCKDYFGDIVADTTLYTDSVAKLNSAPIIDSGTILHGTLNEDDTISGLLTAIDVDDDLIQWMLADSTSHGTVTFMGTLNEAKYNYVPFQHYNGVDSAKVVAFAGIHSDTIVLAFTVNPINDLPLIYVDSVITGGALFDSDLSVQVTCTDNIDSIQSPLEVRYQWFSDRDTLNYDGGLVSTDSVLTVVDSLALSYFYLITQCIDEDNSVVQDTSLYSNRLIPQNSSATTQKTMHFDGVDDIIDLDPLNPDVDDGLTFEFLVFLDSFHTGTVLTLSEDGQAVDLSIGVSHDSLKVEIGSNIFSIQEFFIEEHWTHVAISVGSGVGNNIHFYKNGMLIEKGTVPALITNAFGVCKMGASLQNVDNLSGTLENVKIWESVRTRTEIKDNIFNENINHSDLYIGWSFDNTSTFFIQSTQGEHYGSMEGTSATRRDAIKRNIVSVVPNSEITITINGDTIDVATDFELAETMLLNLRAFPGIRYNFVRWITSKASVIFEGGGQGDSLMNTDLSISEASELSVDIERYTLADTRNSVTMAYHYIVMDSTAWMAENLKYLPEVFGTDQYSGIEPRFYVYGYSGIVVANALLNTNYDKYGVLYNWKAANDNVCPLGWRLPTNEDWTKLLEGVNDMYPSENESEVLRENWSTYWENDKGKDSILFGARGGGMLSAVGTPAQALFEYNRQKSFWWSSDVVLGTLDSGWSWALSDVSTSVENILQGREDALSIRCVQDL